MSDPRRGLGTFLVILAAVFWGSMGLFVRYLSERGFDPIQITSCRLSLAALVFSALAGARGELAIRPRDLPLFLGLGLGSILFFTVCYFTAITMMPLSTAAILLYTSPIWVMLLSALLLGEKLTGRKLLALCLAFGGCVLVSGLGGGGLSAKGLLIGLGAGLGYGLYSILGSVALRRYSACTVTAWTFVVAALGSWLLRSPFKTLSLLSPAPLRLGLFLVLTAVVTAVIPFLAYTLGLERVEPDKAAVLATVEPLVAALLGVLAFHEPMTWSAALGILLILTSVVLLSLRPRELSAKEGKALDEHEQENASA